MTVKIIFDNKVLDSLTRDTLAKILINYANNIGCWLLKNEALTVVPKEEFEEFVKQEQNGVKALFIQLIIAMQDQILKGYHMASSKHSETETTKKEMNKLTSEINTLEECKTNQTSQIATLTIERDNLNREIVEKDKKIKELEDEITVKNAADMQNTELIASNEESPNDRTNESNRILSALANQQKNFFDRLKESENRDSINRMHRTKIELIQPFHGTHTENFANWFFIVEKFQRTNKIHDDDMLDVIAPLFRGNALLMLKRFEQVNGKGKYREFMEKLKSITDVKVYNDNLRKKLDQLTQKDSFENYL